MFDFLVINRLSLEEDLSRSGRELVKRNVTFVVVRDPDFVPAVVVEISPSESTNSATDVNNRLAFVSKATGVSHNVSSMITVSSYKDVRGSLSFVSDLGPHSVRESRCHVRYEQTKLVLKVRGEYCLFPLSLH
jgi:hypothetical protein